MKCLSRPFQSVMTVLLAGVAMWVCACSGSEIPDVGRTDIGPRAVIKADDNTVAEILAMFHRAEEALHARDIDALMELYARDYSYLDLKKNDVQKIWKNLFAQYSQLSSTHVFSKIAAEGGKPSAAEITCTGRLWGTSKESGERVLIDSWFFEVHHLVSEKGVWRVRGLPGEPPESLGFPVTPHPFF
jgi:ketosteroid isomerase-like protein